MRQRALLLSLTVHAGVIAWAAHTLLPTRGEVGAPALAVRLGADSGAGALLEPAVASAPESSPTPTLPVAEFVPPPPEAAPVGAAPEPSPVLTPPVVTTSAPEPTAPLPTVVRAKPRAQPEPRASSAPARKAAPPAGSTAGEAQGSRAEGGSSGGGGGGGGEGSRLGYVPPHFLLRYKPLYPPAARAQHLEGTALLLVAIDSQGHVTHATLRQSSGYAILDRAALEAVRAWRFEPARQGGLAVAAEVELPVKFRFID